MPEVWDPAFRSFKRIADEQFNYGAPIDDPLYRKAAVDETSIDEIGANADTHDSRKTNISAARQTPASRLIQSVDELYLGAAQVDLWEEEPRDVSLQRLSVEPGHRNLGYANDARDKVCEVADRFGVTLHLEAHPDEDEEDLNAYRLVQFYKRFGFTGADTPEVDAMMARTPRRAPRNTLSSAHNYHYRT